MTSLENAEVRASRTTTDTEQQSLGARLLDPALLRDYGIVAAVIGLFIVFSSTAPNFLTGDNLRNVVDQNAYLAITAFGATLVIIVGGFDLSVGALFAFTGVVAAWVAVNVGPVAGLLAGFGAGLGVGLLSGLLITGLRVHSFLITLAMGIILGGVSISITEGRLIDASDHAAFTYLGQEELITGVPNTIPLVAIVALALTFVLRRTSFGRYIFAVGGNAVAARLAGVRVSLVIITTFAISGLMASIGGLIEVSRAGTGQAEPGNAGSLALDAIAAVVVGGTSIYGGRGAIWRTALGVLLLALLNNGFNLLGVASEWQSIVSGAIIIVAVGLNALSGRR